MFTDPLSLTVATVAKTLPRVSVGDRSATYESSVDGLTFKITHVIGKRHRHTVRLDVNKVAADPLIAGSQRPYSMSALLIIDEPPTGFTDTEVRDAAKAVADFIANTANLTKVVAGES